MTAQKGPPERRSPGAFAARAASTLPRDGAQCNGLSIVAAQSVSWWSVHTFITAKAAEADDLPPAGTPRWCALADDDPRKLLALAVAGEHHVLRTEIAQEQHAQASHDISAAADWTAVAKSIRARREWRDSRPWANRGAA